MGTTFRLRFLGTVQMERDGQPVRGFRSRKALALLGYLATQDRPIPRESLVDLFWEGKPEAEGRANLSWVLNKISSLLPGCLQADRHAIELAGTNLFWLDVRAFQSLVSKKEAAALAEAMGLYRGEYLEGLELKDCAEFSLWLVGERERWRERAAAVLDELVAHHNRCGEYGSSLLYARRLLALEPWREETHRQLMRLLSRSGQRSAALAQYQVCRQILVKELDVEPMQETTTLYERIRAADLMQRHNLPAQPTLFIGRERELAQVMSLLDQPDCRLLTITGHGGIGKTRLALQAAAAQATAFLEGVYFVPLASIGIEHLGSAIANAIGFSFFGPGEPQAQLVNYLHGKEMLLILDTMEHLLTGTALLVQILEKAPDVKLLVTSRERLNLRWEWCFQLEGLTYLSGQPAQGEPREDGSAIRLFEHIAQQARVQFEPLTADRQAIGRICQLVEGMPLGIELAAAWISARSCQEIATELERGLSVLTTSLQDAPERHRSIRATFEHSWQLLAPNDQRTLAELTIFRHGFQQEAAGQVANTSPTVLQSLADKSLLRRLPPDRYEMHELLRQYAAEKMNTMPEAYVAVQDRHCAYYTELLQSLEIDLYGTDAAQALATIKTELENVRAAWQWASTHARLQEIERSLSSLARFYLLAGPYQEGEVAIGMAIEHLRLLAAQTAPSSPDVQIVLSKLLAEHARFYNAQGLCKEAIAAAKEAVELGTTVGQAGLQASGYLQWGQAHWQQRNYEEARAMGKQALALAQASHMKQVEAASLNQLGLVCWHLSDYAAATTYFDQALHILREIKDWKGESGVLISYGCVCGYQDKYTEAENFFGQALRIFRQAGDRKGECVALINLGLVTNLQGRYPEAGGFYKQGLGIAHELGDRPDEGLALINLGYISDQSGDYAEATRCYQRALRFYREIGDRQGESLTLACLCLLSHHLGNNETACEYGQQSLQMAREIGNRHVQGYALTRLGHAWSGVGRLEEAAATYHQALSLRRELGQPNLVVEVLASLARVSLAQGDFPQARAHTDEILRHMESSSHAAQPKSGLEGADEPYRIYLTCYQVLREARDPRAACILHTAQRLLEEQAAHIDDDALRHAFTGNVAAHRELLSEQD